MKKIWLLLIVIVLGGCKMSSDTNEEEDYTSPDGTYYEHIGYFDIYNGIYKYANRILCYSTDGVVLSNGDYSTELNAVIDENPWVLVAGTPKQVGRPGIRFNKCALNVKFAYNGDEIKTNGYELVNDTLLVKKYDSREPLTEDEKKVAINDIQEIRGELES